VPFRSDQNLFIDADDTLWENNVYFERVIASVQAMLHPFGVDPAAFRRHLDDLERRHVVDHGYGTLNFAGSLVAAFEAFLPSSAPRALAVEVEGLALGILEQPVEILDGVPETLEYLAARHVLYILTKGNHAEQSRKVEASRLGAFFRGVEVVREKHAETYAELVARHGLDTSRTWMIGNSVRSDIHPAISAGLSAVFIPHRHTWALEHEEPRAHPRLLEVERFADLCAHF
jgi:putative hydrolase of the HAD superfamily